MVLDRSTLKGIAAVTLSAAALVTALATASRRPPEDAARAGYLELTKALLDVQAVERQNHEDVVALRKYVDEYTREHEVLTVPVQPAYSGVPQAALPPPAIVRAYAAPSASPPPAIAPLGPPAAPKKFDSLL
jgi:hypothetical protein